MNKSGTQFNLAASLKKISHDLPSQGPIKDFIHHNPLHALQHLPFHEAIATTDYKLGSLGYMPIHWYQMRWKNGEISKEALQKVFENHAIVKEDWPHWEKKLLEPSKFEKKPLGTQTLGIRSRWLRNNEIDLNRLVHPTLFRILAGYLDQGISIWHFPYTELPFWEAFRLWVQESKFPVLPFLSKELEKLLDLSSSDFVLRALSYFVEEPSSYEDYLCEMLLSHPGWSGMISVLEHEPQLLNISRTVSLVDLCAIELFLEWAWLKRKKNHFKKASSPPKRSKPKSSFVHRLWHEAFEWSYYYEVLGALEIATKKNSSNQILPDFAQILFCIDERFGSIRRHIEELDPHIETLATAGFFGVDFMFMKAGTSQLMKYCPVLLEPKHLVKELECETGTTKAPSFEDFFLSGHRTNTIFRGGLLTQVLGLWSTVELFWNVFRPRQQLLGGAKLSQEVAHYPMQLFRPDNSPQENGYWLGYTVAEMTERVAAVLKNMGVIDRFGKLLLVVGHGSSSANNPHFAAYDCGACAGKPGEPNARAFSMMFNHPDVRKLLLQKGFKIPSACYALGALYNTTRDDLTFFGLESLPDTHKVAFQKLRATLEEALKRNALERSRRFELEASEQTPLEALYSVRKRSESLFEPRPELNHATNAFCFIGRRSSIRHLFLDRRAFMHSYDYSLDPEGVALLSILNAVIPVCGGINLEYYFSKVDNATFGAGSKLPHNVVSLLGVANGVEGDLQTGLPSQMVELHDPIRLLIAIENNPDFILRVLEKNSLLKEWVINEWVRLAALCPTTHKTYVIGSSGVEKVFSEKVPFFLPEINSSLDISKQGGANLRTQWINGGRS